MLQFNKMIIFFSMKYLFFSLIVSFNLFQSFASQDPVKFNSFENLVNKHWPKEKKDLEKAFNAMNKAIQNGEVYVTNSCYPTIIEVSSKLSRKVHIFSSMLHEIYNRQIIGVVENAKTVAKLNTFTAYPFRFDYEATEKGKRIKKESQQYSVVMKKNFTDDENTYYLIFFVSQSKADIDNFLSEKHK